MKHIITSVILTIVLGVSASAAEWEKFKLTVKSSESNEAETVSVIEAEGGTQFVLKYSKDVSPLMLENIVRLNSEFRKWKSMKVSRIEFSVLSNNIEVVIIPSEYSYEGVNIIPNLPAGMLFIFDDSLKYNFRVIKDNIFVRIEGRFSEENNLNKTIVEAIKDPVAYLQKNNPRYIISKLQQLEDANAKLTVAVMALYNTGFFGGTKPVDQKKVSRIISIKNENPKFKTDDIQKILKQEKIDASDKEVKLVLSVFFNEFQ